jgi:hypothetical protein
VKGRQRERETNTGENIRKMGRNKRGDEETAVRNKE